MRCAGIERKQRTARVDPPYSKCTCIRFLSGAVCVLFHAARSRSCTQLTSKGACGARPRGLWCSWTVRTRGATAAPKGKPALTQVIVSEREVGNDEAGDEDVNEDMDEDVDEDVDEDGDEFGGKGLDEFGDEDGGEDVNEDMYEGVDEFGDEDGGEGVDEEGVDQDVDQDVEKVKG